jgi:hypothetical protein
MNLVGCEDSALNLRGPHFDFQQPAFNSDLFAPGYCCASAEAILGIGFIFDQVVPLRMASVFQSLFPMRLRAAFSKSGQQERYWTRDDISRTGLREEIW